MSLASQKTPLRPVLELRLSAPGRYPVEFPPSTCFGTVTLGGLVMAAAHKAASDFTSRAPGMKAHSHLVNIAFQFFRPTLPAPTETFVEIRVKNAARSSTTFHVDIIQNNKNCCAGYIVMANLSAPGELSMETGWQLSPPPPPTSIPSLEADLDPEWVSYLTPFTPAGYRRAQSYMKYYVPIKGQNRSLHTIDQWVTPGWKDEGLETGAVWTNELLHFALDNCVPTMNDLSSSFMGDPSRMLENVVAAGLEQRQARLEGKDDRIFGKGLTESDSHPWVNSTSMVTTQIVRLLPEEGTKWLFMRVITRSFVDNRTDYDIVVMDAQGKLVAISHHMMNIVPRYSKFAKKGARL